MITLHVGPIYHSKILIDEKRRISYDFLDGFAVRSFITIKNMKEKKIRELLITLGINDYELEKIANKNAKIIKLGNDFKTPEIRWKFEPSERVFRKVRQRYVKKNLEYYKKLSNSLYKIIEEELKRSPKKAMIFIDGIEELYRHDEFLTSEFLERLKLSDYITIVADINDFDVLLDISEMVDLIGLDTYSLRNLGYGERNKIEDLKYVCDKCTCIAKCKNEIFLIKNDSVHNALIENSLCEEYPGLIYSALASYAYKKYLKDKPSLTSLAFLKHIVAKEIKYRFYLFNDMAKEASV